MPFDPKELESALAAEQLSLDTAAASAELSDIERVFDALQEGSKVTLAEDVAASRSKTEGVRTQLKRLALRYGEQRRLVIKGGQVWLETPAPTTRFLL